MPNKTHWNRLIIFCFISLAWLYIVLIQYYIVTLYVFIETEGNAQYWYKGKRRIEIILPTEAILSTLLTSHHSVPADKINQPPSWQISVSSPCWCDATAYVRREREVWRGEKKVVLCRRFVGWLLQPQPSPVSRLAEAETCSPTTETTQRQQDIP